MEKKIIINLSNESFSQDPLWPNKYEDVRDALKIIEENSDNGTIKFIEHFEEMGDNLKIVMPEWLIAMMEHFRVYYGEQTMEVINQLVKVLFQPVFGLSDEETRADQIFIRQQPTEYLN